MRQYQRVTNAVDLAQVTATPESWEVDFKTTVNPAEWWELAKDVAAFASYLGGVIVVGAKEQAGRPVEVSGISAEHADRVAEAYRQAARNRCRPVPHLEVVPIPVEGTDKIVVSVNVDPLPDQHVAAQFYRLNQAGSPEVAEAWPFPVRVGAHTDFIDPARLPMYINAQVRRTVIHLHAASAANPVTVIWRRPSNQFDESPVESQSSIKDVDLGMNAVKLNVNVSRNSRPVDVQVPLEDVDAVWEARPGEWAVRITGFFEDGRYLKNPSNAVIRR